VQAGSRNRTLNMEAVTGIYDVTSEKDAFDMCVDRNGGMIMYGICCWNFLLNPCYRTLLENCVLLRYYAASSGSFSPTFRDNLTVPSSGVKNPKKRTPEDGTDRPSPKRR